MSRVFGADRCNDFEYQDTNGVWKRLGPRTIGASAHLRRAPHLWETIGPRLDGSKPGYRRCRSCGRVETI